MRSMVYSHTKESILFRVRSYIHYSLESYRYIFRYTLEKSKGDLFFAVLILLISRRMKIISGQ